MSVVDNATAIAVTRDPLLGITRRFLDAFHEHAIEYCHWKSNEHLREGLDGDTDLDILVTRRHALQAQGILADLGFKRFANAAPGAYPAVEDYLGFDSESGELIHLHLHYRLVLGEKHLKGYCLPWEDELIGRRHVDSETGCFVAPADTELLLLLLRSAVKLRARDRVKRALGRSLFGADSSAEYRWLLERTDPDAVADVAERLLGAPAAGAIRPLLTEAPTLETLMELRRAAMPTLRLHRTYGVAGANARRWAREVTWLVGGINLKTVRRPWPFRKHLPTGGLFVAVVGADGSGKTTLLAALSSWLAWKLDVYRVYHGSGDGHASLLRTPLVLLKPLFGRSKNAGGKASRKGLGWARAGWALALSQEKRGKLADSWHARNRGMVVLADRYPQAQVAGFNDGPLLTEWLHHPRLARLARWEQTPYLWADAKPPDLVIKLVIDAPTALLRKPDDMDLEEVERRVQAVAGLHFPAEDTVLLDARQSQERVLLEAKRAIWERL